MARGSVLDRGMSAVHIGASPAGDATIQCSPRSMPTCPASHDDEIS